MCGLAVQGTALTSRGQLNGTADSSGAEAEEHEESPLELDQRRCLDPSDHFMRVAPADRGELVDHQEAVLVEPVHLIRDDRHRRSGASTGALVNGQTVTELVASNRSSSTINAGRGLLA